MNRLIYLIPLVVLAGFGVLFTMGLNRDSNEMPTALAGQETPAIPELEIEGFEGGDLAEIFAQNDVVLVNFWASWCAPCRAEHPNLDKLKEEGIAIVGINYKDNLDNAASFLDEMGNPFAAIRADDNGRSAIDWGVAGVPETFFVKDGKVVDRHTGPIVGDKYQEVLAKYEALQSN